ncbi:MAG: hypothetical protein R3B70_07915 [Polyangiaceae bacterium]
MHEDHKREQYFFDPPTRRWFADILERYAHPCCLCAPMIAEELHRRRKAVRVLDIDPRFSHLPGFQKWDLHRPEPLPERFDVIACDPPFTKVSLARLFTALRVLCQGDLTTPILLCHLASRSADVCGTLAPFGLRPTDIEAGYVSVRPIEENRVLVYSNFDLPTRPSPEP